MMETLVHENKGTQFAKKTSERQSEKKNAV